MGQKLFNFKRFYNVFKYDLMLNIKTYMTFGGGLILALLLIDIFFVAVGGSQFQESNYIVLFYFTFLISSVVVIGTSFPFLRNKKTMAYYFMLPASTLEKLLVQFIIRIVFFIPFYVLIFWLDFKLITPVLRIIRWPDIIQVDNFNLLTPFENLPFQNTFLDSLAFAGMIFTIATFLFVGATYFKKYAVFKTILSFCLLVGCIFLLFRIFTLIFYPVEFKAGYYIHIIDYKISEHLYNVQLFAYVIAIGSPFFLLTLSYFKLKEKQV